MKNVVKMMGTVSMIAMLTACGGVEPQAGDYEIQVDVTATEDGAGLISRVTLLDSLGRIAAEEEVEGFQVAQGLDVNEILKKLRVEVRVDGPPDFYPEPDPIEATSQTLSNDGWGSFTGQILREFPGEMAAEVTISLDSNNGEEVYEMVYVPIHDAMKAGVAVPVEASGGEELFESDYSTIRGSVSAGLVDTARVNAQ